MSSPKKKTKSVKKPAPKTKTVAAKSKAPKHKSNVTLLKMPRPSLMAQLGNNSGGEKLSPRLQSMIDRSEIEQVLATFARGVDRIDENLLRAVLHPDASIDLGPGVFQGGGNDYVHWVLGVLNNLRSTHHLLGQIRIDLSGDMALVESYFHLHCRVEKPVGREDVFMGGRNLDRLERRPSGASGIWKIIHRKQIIDWVRTEAVSDIFYHQNPDALWSYRTKADPSYQMAQFPGSSSGGKTTSFLGRRYENKSIRF